MTTYTITGPISDVSGAKSRITGAWVRASDTRAAGSGITTEENAPVTISTAGVASFQAAPGPAVLVLSSAGEVVETVPLIIPENNASLGDVARAGALAGESWSAIQGLAKRALDALSGAETARDAAEGHASAAAGSAGAAASTAASMNDALAGAVAGATAEAEGYATAAQGYAEAAEQALTDGIPDGAVTTGKIADGAVTGPKIDPNYRQETSMVDVPITIQGGGSGMLRIIKNGRLVAIHPEGLLAGRYWLLDDFGALEILGGTSFMQPISTTWWDVGAVHVLHTCPYVLIEYHELDDSRTPIIYMSANDTPLDPSNIYQIQE